VTRKAALAGEASEPFVFFRLRTQWVYAVTRAGPFVGLPNIRSVTVALSSHVRHPRPHPRLHQSRGSAHTNACERLVAFRTRCSVLSLCLCVQVFNPEKFEELGGRLAAAYGASAQPPLVLRAYLAVMARGAWDGDGSSGRFALGDYDDRAALVGGSLKGIA
jgi:hypothetical protein